MNKLKTSLHLALTTVFAVAATTGSPDSQAVVVDSRADYYLLKHQGESSLSAEKLWQKLIKPATWWHPNHTYSGDASKLSLELQPGGKWIEVWGNNFVEHGRVISVIEGKQIRLEAPFGPLQEMAVTVIWTININPKGKGSTVTFNEIANGSSQSGLDKIADAVDGVKQQAIDRLVATTL